MIFEPRDYNADGHVDLMVQDSTTLSLTLIPGTGTSMLGKPEVMSFVPPLPFDANLSVLADLDLHQSIDVVQHGPGDNEITVYYNITEPFAHTETIDVGVYVTPIAVMPDIDANGHSELIVSHRVPVPVSPSYSAPRILFDFLDESREMSQTELSFPINFQLQYAVYPTVRRLIVPRDIDHDGDLDLMFLWSGSSLHTKENSLDTTARAFFGNYPAPSDKHGPYHVLPANLDQDPELEAVVGSDDTLWTHDFQTGITTEVSGTEDSFESVIMDIDGDGVDEIVTTHNFQGSDIRILKPTPGGSLEVTSALDFDQEVNVNGVAVGDFNEDGRDDILLPLNAQGRLVVYQGQPDGTLTLLAELPQISTYSVVRPAALDFNQDGHLDLAIGLRNEQVIEMYAGDGTGTFSHAHSIPDINPYWVEPEDIDNNGTIDLLVGRFTDGAAIHYLDEAGALVRTETLGIQGGYEIVANAFNGTIRGSYIFFQESDGTFQSIVHDFNVLSVTGVEVADINLDGADDLLVVTDEDEALRVHYGIPNPCPADLNNDGQLNFFDVSAFLVNESDYNNDGSFNFFDVTAFIEDYLAGCP